MTLKNQIMKLQTYKMYEDEDTVYVERDDVLKLLEQQTCEGCISRAEVLKYAQLIRDDEGIVHEMVHVDDIKDAPSVTWSSWTPATQLPPAHEAVLLYVKYKSSGQWTYQMGYWEDALEKWEKWLEIGTLDDEFEVIAWMELPEKYEEGEDE